MGLSIWIRSSADGLFAKKTVLAIQLVCVGSARAALNHLIRPKDFSIPEFEEGRRDSRTIGSYIVSVLVFQYQATSLGIQVISFDERSACYRPAFCGFQTIDGRMKPGIGNMASQRVPCVLLFVQLSGHMLHKTARLDTAAHGPV